jgi:hypothetical protein
MSRTKSYDPDGCVLTGYSDRRMAGMTSSETLFWESAHISNAPRSEVLDKRKAVCYICINWVTAQSVYLLYSMRAPHGEGRA